jgi:hypothetical protein
MDVLNERDARAWLSAAARGDFEDAWCASDRIRGRSVRDLRLPRHMQQVWDGTDLRGRRVLIRCYHGLGDTIQFIRYARLVRAVAREVIVWAPPRLLPLLQSATGIDRLLPLHDGTPGVDYDVDVEVMELPYVFRTTLPSIPRDVPYLTATPRTLPGDRPRIGLAWRGGPWNSKRSIPFAACARLLDRVDLSWYSLQQAVLPHECHRHLHRVDCDSIEATAEYISSLDLVITIDSMMAHLAGALAAPVWTLLMREADWRWMEARSDCPWYPTMRLFRQTRQGDWDSVIDEVSDELTVAIDRGPGELNRGHIDCSVDRLVGGIMPREVQRGGEAEPDGPGSRTRSETPDHRPATEEKPADRGQGKVSPRTPGKAEGEKSTDQP